MRKFIYWTLPVSLHCLLPILLFISGLLFFKLGGYRLIELYQENFDWSPSAGLIVASYLVFCSWMVIIPSYIFLVALNRVKYIVAYWVGFWAVVTTLFAMYAHVRAPFICLIIYMIVILYLIPFTLLALRLHRNRDKWLTDSNWIESLKRILTWQRIVAAVCISFVTAVTICFISVWTNSIDDKYDLLRFDPTAKCSYEFTNHLHHGFINAESAGCGGTITIFYQDKNEWKLGTEVTIDNDNPKFSFEIYTGDYRVEYTPKHRHGRYGRKVEIKIKRFKNY